MKKTKNSKTIEAEKQETDLRGTIVGFIAPEPEEKTQEQEIQDFKLKKQTDKELQQLSDEEKAKRQREYDEEEERIEKVKAELIQSIKVRIPAIEKKFKMHETQTQKGKVVERVNQKSRTVKKEPRQKNGPTIENDGKERE